MNDLFNAEDLLELPAEQRWVDKTVDGEGYQKFILKSQYLMGDVEHHTEKLNDVYNGFLGLQDVLEGEKFAIFHEKQRWEKVDETTYQNEKYFLMESKTPIFEEQNYLISDKAGNVILEGVDSFEALPILLDMKNINAMNKEEKTSITTKLKQACKKASERNSRAVPARAGDKAVEL